MISKLSPEMKEAIATLKEIIREKYPEATFAITQGEEPRSIHLLPTIDAIETDPLLDLVMDQVLAFQEEQSLDIHVIPLRTWQKEAVLQERLRRESGQHTAP